MHKGGERMKNKGLKSFIKSKTLWIGALEVVGGVALAAAGQLSIGGSLTLSGVLKIVLRIVTKTKISWN